MAENTLPVFMTISGISQQTGWSKPRIYEFAARADDPLPLRFIKGTERGGVVIVDELKSWLDRNSVNYGERG